MTIACPRCCGLIACNAVGTSAGVSITLNAFDVRRHATCFAPPPDGEPLLEAA